MCALGRLLITILLAVLAVSHAVASERVALIIGNSKYQYTEPLRNAARDARDISAKLSELGFKTFLAEDVSSTGFNRTIRAFVDDLRDAETALFFYSGHGVQVDGVNFLIPVDTRLETATDIVLDSVPLQDILRLMQRNAKTTVVLLDACQNDPFQKRGAGAGARGASLSTGLAAENGAAGSYISFATQPGQFSFDGAGSNSPFTKALIRHMSQPEVDIRIIMSDVRKDVIAETGGRQIPWENNSLTGRLYLNPKAAKPAEDSPDTGLTAEQKAWSAIVASENPADYLDFLEIYPAGIFAQTARAQLRRLLAASSPAPSPAEESGSRTATLEPEPDQKAPAVIVGGPSMDESIRSMQPPEIKALQQQLIKVGCLDGAADGQWGRRSARALARYRDAVSAENLQQILASLSSARRPTCAAVKAEKDTTRTQKVMKPKRETATSRKRSQRPIQRKPAGSSYCTVFDGKRVCG